MRLPLQFAASPGTEDETADGEAHEWPAHKVGLHGAQRRGYS
jgi:hypothetical protein